ncbi:hypothetical protein [Pannonibacter tanglangensis]|uniref:Uncharacterized protein n=1 Tax=Pannonibacter tanglangensis TaxID=2750084 RepID=A0ABW9ZSD5_9HYPH|nr:hypothetical protein [Pannonibacter sp. XCT-34]NBN65942.1 hypothetical protein [Pannonibacter sp. XCT-34]
MKFGLRKYLIATFVFFLGAFTFVFFRIDGLGLIETLWRQNPPRIKEEICSPSRNNCVIKITTNNGFGPNSTKTVLLNFNKSAKSDFSDFQEPYAIFEPEAFVDLMWLDDETLEVHYSDGEFEIHGKMPISFKILWRKD